MNKLIALGLAASFVTAVATSIPSFAADEKTPAAKTEAKSEKKAAKTKTKASKKEAKSEKKEAAEKAAK